MQTDKVKENLESKIITQKLPCVLTREESHRYAKECAAMVRECEDLDRKRRTINTDYQEQIKDITSKLRKRSDIVNANQEFRNIDCRQEFDYLKARVRTYRTDTNELIEDRDMTAKEGQRPLFMGGGDEDDDDQDE